MLLKRNFAVLGTNEAEQRGTISVVESRPETMAQAARASLKHEPSKFHT